MNAPEGRLMSHNSETLSAYVRRTRGDVEGLGPDWLADRIAGLESDLEKRVQWALKVGTR